MTRRFSRAWALAAGVGLVSFAASADATPTVPITSAPPAVGQAADLDLDKAIGAVGIYVPLRATIRAHDTHAPIAGQTVTFKVEGQALGTATSDANGVATYTAWPIPDTLGAGPAVIEASFAGTSAYLGARAKNVLTIVKSATRLFCNVSWAQMYLGLVSPDPTKPIRPRDMAAISCSLKRITDRGLVTPGVVHLKVNGKPISDVQISYSATYATFTVPDVKWMSIEASYDGDKAYLPSTTSLRRPVTAGATPLYLSLDAPTKGVVGETVTFTIHAGQKPAPKPGAAPAEPLAGVPVSVMYDASSIAGGDYGMMSLGPITTDSKGVAVIKKKLDHASIVDLYPALAGELEKYWDLSAGPWGVVYLTVAGAP